MRFAPVFFQAPKVGLLFDQVSLGPPLAESQKMADLVFLAQLVITRLCGHFWSRRLRQNVARCWHLMARLISRSRRLRPAFSQAQKFAHFLADFALVPPLRNLRKWPIWVPLRDLS